ncbi:hypothetical protein ACUSIJ_22315 [Pseudochelatococcus sp. B33]
MRRLHWLNRFLRAAIPCVVAYGLAAHLILLAFATTVMAMGSQGRADSIVIAARGDVQVAIRLATVLCRPGAAWSDAFDAGEHTNPDRAPARLCCGICALQGAGLPGPAGAYALLTPEWRRALALGDIREAPRLAAPRLSPPARGPPAT